jgi:Trk K+ transport system NAD-binding subunit
MGEQWRGPDGPGDLSALNGHVIVCGLDGVGLRTVEQLHLAGVAVVVIDDQPDPRLSRIIASWDVAHIIGSARLADTLLRAGLPSAAAVVCVENDELDSLETALLVNELSPGTRLVVQLANAAVGHAVTDVTGTGSVLDVAELAAPSVVEACLQRTSHELDLDGDGFVVAAVPVGHPSTVRQEFGELAPVAVVAAADNAVSVCPGRDHPVIAGDTVHVVGTPAELDDFGLSWRDGAMTGGAMRRHRLVDQARHAIVSLLAEADRGLKLAVAALGLVVIVATTVLMIGYRKPDGAHMSLLDGVYFSVETIGTIGYGDFYFADQAPWLRIFAIGLMISGVLLAAVFFALLTNLLVSRRLEESLGRRAVGGMSGHVIVVGLGSIGLRVVERILAEGTAVVVVERDENNRYLAQARALGVPVIVADATLRRTLQDVNLGTARAVAVLTSNDLTNIETGLAVRDALEQRWATVPVVVRLFDRQLARTIERTFGFRHVRSTAALAAPWFVGAALGLEILSTFYVEDQPFLLARLKVAVGGGLDGLPMSQLSGRTRVIGIRRAAPATWSGAPSDSERSVADRLEHPPRRDTRFAAHDIAYLVGPYEELLQVLRRDGLSTSQLTAPPAPPGLGVTTPVLGEAGDIPRPIVGS